MVATSVMRITSRPNTNAVVQDGRVKVVVQKQEITDLRSGVIRSKELYAVEPDLGALLQSESSRFIRWYEWPWQLLRNAWPIARATFTAWTKW